METDHRRRKFIVFYHFASQLQPQPSLPNNSQLNTNNLPSNLNLAQQQMLQSNMNTMSSLPSNIQSIATKLEQSNALRTANNQTGGGNVPPNANFNAANQFDSCNSMMGLGLNFDDPVEQSLASLEQQDVKPEDMLANAQRMSTMIAGHNGGTQWPNPMNRSNMKSDMDNTNPMDMMLEMTAIMNKSAHSQALMQQLGYDSMHHSNDGAGSGGGGGGGGNANNNGFNNMDPWTLSPQGTSMPVQGGERHNGDRRNIAQHRIYPHDDGAVPPISTSGMMMGAGGNTMTQPNAMPQLSNQEQMKNLYAQRTAELARQKPQNVRRHHAENGVGIPTSSSVGMPARRDNAPIRADSSQMHRMDTDSHRYDADVQQQQHHSQHHQHQQNQQQQQQQPHHHQQQQMDADVMRLAADRSRLAADRTRLAVDGGNGGGNGITVNAGGFRPKPIEELMKPPPSTIAAVNEAASKGNIPPHAAYSNKPMDQQFNKTLVASSWSSLAAAGSPQNTPTSNKPKPATDSFQAFRNKAKEKADRQKLLEQQQVLNRSHKEAEKRQQEQQKKRDEVDSVR